jgi:murein DD-endopeptidase MepM/ murein hydrolase activator NlpD
MPELAIADFIVLDRHPFPAAHRTLGDPFGAPRDGGRVHLGEDYPMPVGTPIYAPRAGVAVAVNNPSGSFGTYVCIDIPHCPWYMLFAHCERAVVGPGEDVVAGQVVAYSGNTGLSTGPHVHAGICRDTVFDLRVESYARLTDFPLRAAWEREVEAYMRGER